MGGFFFQFYDRGKPNGGIASAANKLSLSVRASIAPFARHFTLNELGQSVTVKATDPMWETYGKIYFHEQKRLCKLGAFGPFGYCD